jgi:hypothetical protein
MKKSWCRILRELVLYSVDFVEVAVLGKLVVISWQIAPASPLPRRHGTVYMKEIIYA